MEEQLISFETAKLAKEKGFNIPLDIYNNVFDLEDNQPMFNIHRDTLLSSPKTWIFRPTQSLLQKWLREKYQIEIIVTIDIEVHAKEELRYIVKIMDWNKRGYIDTPIATLYNIPHQHFIDYNSYEQALEKGLQEALKLI